MRTVDIRLKMWTFVCAKCSVKSSWASDFTPSPPKGKIRPRRHHCARCIAYAQHEAKSEVCTSCLRPVSPTVSAAESARALARKSMGTLALRIRPKAPA